MPAVDDSDEVSALLERVLAAFRRPFELAGNECFVSACAGVAMFPRDGDAAGLLLSRAESALTEAKAKGARSIGWYAPVLRGGGRVRLRMLCGLHKALERRELELAYQPCVDASTGAVLGVEALARWTHEGAPVSPAEFIALAEENGLIVPIGEWALDEAGRQMRRWIDAGVRVPKVSVNVSSLHFERSSLAASVRAIIEQHRLAPGMLELELTESVMVRDFDRSLRTMRALRELGVDLSLDDFGTGYSSLSYLTRLPIGKLKIDRGFVRLIGTSAEDEAVVRAVVALGRSLGLQLVAEGVETAAQARALLEMDCRCMQGYLFSRPVPAGAMAAVVERLAALVPVGAPRQASAAVFAGLADTRPVDRAAQA
jgi:EAL domain-containing protein (putative c-di-GMP-specific phosphodiesterase class I)